MQDLPSTAVLGTELILEVFRLNGRLLAAGDRLVADLGLTSARWQVLGAIGMSETALPVAQLARNMGLNRQGVQRIANELAAEGFLDFIDNPNHRRARLVVLTRKGLDAYHAAMKRQGPWLSALVKGLSRDDLRDACQTIRRLRERLERSE